MITKTTKSWIDGRYYKVDLSSMEPFYLNEYSLVSVGEKFNVENVGQNSIMFLPAEGVKVNGYTTGFYVAQPKRILQVEKTASNEFEISALNRQIVQQIDSPNGTWVNVMTTLQELVADHNIGEWILVDGIDDYPQLNGKYQLQWAIYDGTSSVPTPLANTFGQPKFIKTSLGYDHDTITLTSVPEQPETSLIDVDVNLVQTMHPLGVDFSLSVDVTNNASWAAVEVDILVRNITIYNQDQATTSASHSLASDDLNNSVAASSTVNNVVNLTANCTPAAVSDVIVVEVLVIGEMQDTDNTPVEKTGRSTFTVT